jgi:hypothetical protein
MDNARLPLQLLPLKSGTARLGAAEETLSKRHVLL